VRKTILTAAKFTPPSMAASKSAASRLADGGAKTDRAQLRRVIEALQSGDVLMVTRLDRLARSTRDPS